MIAAMRLLMGLMIAGSLIGCQRHKKSPCEPAVYGAVDRMIKDMSTKMSPTISANIARIAPDMKKSITEACEQDKWAPAVIECVANAKGRDALNACDAMLTPEQRADERKRDDELLKTAVQPLRKPDADKGYRDPHAGLGIPSVEELQGNTPLNAGGGSGSAGAGSAAPVAPTP
jgi:small lipoprotein (TIGR04454 family)